MEHVLEVPQQEESTRRSRRSALLMGGAALAGLAVSRAANAQATLTDSDILNFALNLEYLEAEFYSLALTGKTIASLDPAAPAVSPVTPATVTKTNFTTPIVAALAAELANDEMNHVTYLQKALGTAAVPVPKIDLSTYFTTNFNFNPFDGTEQSFLLGAFVFEDVGVTAYSGAAPAISSAAYLGAASSILAVEAYHAASIRTLIATLYPGNAQKTVAIANARAMLDGTAGTPAGADDIGVSVNAVATINGVTVTGGATTIADVNSNGLTSARTTRQVLNIVYGGIGATKGGFFPNGMNGTIK